MTPSWHLSAFFSKAAAKVLLFFELTKYLGKKMQSGFVFISLS